MLLVSPSFEILTPMDREEVLEWIELAGRTCYKSEGRITEDSASVFVRKIVEIGHESVIEHVSLTVKFVIDRGVSHELVRHRIASFSQESTRYCDYSGGQVCFVIPPWLKTLGLEEGEVDISIWDRNKSVSLWLLSMARAEREYLDLRRIGWSPQKARSVLPNSLKTEIVMSANLREWKYVLSLRTSKKAHPQMREVMIPLQDELRKILPEVFGTDQRESEFV